MEGEHPKHARAQKGITARPAWLTSHNIAVSSVEVAETQDSGDSANER